MNAIEKICEDLNQAIYDLESDIFSEDWCELTPIAERHVDKLQKIKARLLANSHPAVLKTGNE